MCSFNVCNNQNGLLNRYMAGWMSVYFRTAPSCLALCPCLLILQTENISPEKLVEKQVVDKEASFGKQTESQTKSVFNHSFPFAVLQWGIIFSCRPTQRSVTVKRCWWLSIDNEAEYWRPLAVCCINYSCSALYHLMYFLLACSIGPELIALSNECWNVTIKHH